MFEDMDTVNPDFPFVLISFCIYYFFVFNSFIILCFSTSFDFTVQCLESVGSWPVPKFN